jgi:hypothetical protein
MFGTYVKGKSVAVIAGADPAIDLKHSPAPSGRTGDMNRPQSRLAPMLVAALMAAMLLYIVVYLLLIARVPVTARSVFVRYDVRYRYGDTALKWVFWPAHQLDRQLRPSLWNSPSEPDAR